MGYFTRAFITTFEKFQNIEKNLKKLFMEKVGSVTNNSQSAVNIELLPRRLAWQKGKQVF